jgi:allantoate deiminase
MSVSESRDFIDRAAGIIDRCKQLATFSEDPVGIRRTFLSPAMHDCHREVAEWLRAAGAEVRVDAAGNLRGFYAASDANAPRLLIGSHLDTIPNAGAYDGILGVLLAIGLLDALQGKRLPFAIEVIGFSEEEGVRFGKPFIGSRALVGRLDEKLLNQQDADGISVRAAIENFGLNPAEIARAEIGEDTLGYLEFHIEQGPVLERAQRQLGVVECIVAQTRMEFTFSGATNHAGTTPMQLRRDAVAGAAEWIVGVERTAQATPGLVATVGVIEVTPGAVNAIPGTARVTLDVRHGSDEICAQAAEKLVQQAKAVAERRTLGLRTGVLLRQESVKMDAFLIEEIEKSTRSVGCEPHRMVSGAGHDAMILAEKVPAAMIFLRSPGGISHNPAESVEVEDVARALQCGLRLLDQLARSAQFLKRTCRA